MNGLSDAAAMVTAVAAAAAVAAGYVQFVLKRSVLPSAEFDVQFTPYVRGDVQLVGEVELIFKNVGSNMLVVTGVRSRIRYRLSTDAEATDFTGNIEPFFAGEVLPPPAVAGGHPSCSLPVSLPSWPPGPSASVAGGRPDAQDTAGMVHPGWLELMWQRTFIQPGVTQSYRKPIALPADTQLVHIWGAFDYRIEIGPVTRFLISALAAPPKDLDWRRGINDHTVRRTFLVPATLRN